MAIVKAYHPVIQQANLLIDKPKQKKPLLMQVLILNSIFLLIKKRSTEKAISTSYNLNSKFLLGMALK